MSDRFTIVSDDDGHDYVIPVKLVKEFFEWLDEDEEDRTEPEKFDEYRHNGGRITFTDPRID